MEETTTAPAIREPVAKPLPKPRAKPKAKAKPKPAAKAAPSRNGKPKASRPKFEARPGTVIKWEYKGKEYKVTVRKDGYELGGKLYSSLTACAKKIIGSDSEISGPAFFKIGK